MKLTGLDAKNKSKIVYSSVSPVIQARIPE